MTEKWQEWNPVDDKRSLFQAQCKTWKVAQRLSNNYKSVSTGDVTNVQPFCLRLKLQYRDDFVNEFRKSVADEVRRLRSMGAEVK